MKTHLLQIKTLVNHARERTARMLLVPAVVLACSPAVMAQGLPQMPTPGQGIGGGAVAQGDWLGAMGAWFKAGITILALVLTSMAFIYVMMGALSKWRAYSMGRAEMADLKEYFIMGAVLAVFIVVIATYALSTLA